MDSNDISINDVFTDEFIQNCSSFINFSEFANYSGISKYSIEEIGKIEDPKLDDFVLNHTKYKNFKEMKTSAFDALMLSLLSDSFIKKHPSKLKLQRYKPINDFIDDLLLNNRHYFATSAELNDPFELKFSLNLSGDLNAIENAIEKHVRALSKKITQS